MVKQTIIVVIITFLASCVTQQVDDCSTYDYSDCITRKPDSSIVIIKFSTSKERPYTFLEIFNGYPDNNNPKIADTFPDGILKIKLPVNQFYSVIANYYGDTLPTVRAIDGQKLRIWKVQVCDSICWNNNQPVIDVRLKK